MQSSLSLVSLTLAILQLVLFSLECILIFITLKIESGNTKALINTRVSNKYLKIHEEKYFTCSIAWRGDG